ncbi:MAG: hypothetical protein WCE40_12775 [Polyangia bacterium]
MKNQNVLVSAVILLASGCASSTPYRPSGPPLSVQGLQIGIADVRCSLDEGDHLIELADQPKGVFDLKLEIKNDSARVARFSERRIRLVDFSAPAARPLTPDDAQVVSVFPGETKELPVTFTTADSLDCRHGFNLVLVDAVQLGEPTPAALSSISIPAVR